MLNINMKDLMPANCRKPYLRLFYTSWPVYPSAGVEYLSKCSEIQFYYIGIPFHVMSRQHFTWINTGYLFPVLSP